jgi:DNA helicase-2/ATP-dependent DNA helicase PcrA
MESPDKHWELKLLTGLFDFIKEETRRNPRLTLDALVTIFSLMNKEGLVLPLAKISGSNAAVNLLTAHGSKGLEFEQVFFVGCNASNWEKKKKPGGGYHLPDTIFVSSPAHKEEEELRRLFYVALTRAAQHLTISYTQYKNDGKEIEPSLFVAEIIDGYGLVPSKINITEEELSAFALIGFSKEQAPEIEKEEADFVNTLLDKFVMNVTALNNYLKCPLQFYYNNLVRVPSGKSEATEFGSAVHFALEMLFQKMQKNNNIFQSKELFIADFNWYMHRHRENFTKEQFDRKIEYGEIVLTSYYDANINSWNKVVLAETNIRNVVIKGVPLKGKLDKIEFDGKSVNVVDYKTGDIDKARPKLKPPHDKDPNGGDYWRQAVFYKILIDNYPSKDWEAISAKFDFIEPDKQGAYKQEKVVVTPQDIATVTNQVETVWQKIKNKEFYTGCGKNECHWCNFVKTNKISIALHELNEEQDESGD